MFRQKTRDLYYAVLLPLSKLNYWRWRIQCNGRRRNADIHLHLGCGRKYLPGFVNIDGNLFRKTDMWLNLIHGLPFPNHCVSSVYASHVFEHFYPDELERVSQECYRVLRPGGGLRAVVPDMGGAVQAYMAGRAEYFFDFPRAHRSIGGKLANLLFCEGGHRQGFDFSYMEEILQNAGFSEVHRMNSNESLLYPQDLFSRICEEEAGLAPYSLVVEARK